MILSADEVAATLRLVIPGFVALSIFYWFGVRVRRPDWRWLVWSLLATVPIAWLARVLADAADISSEEPSAAFADCGVNAAQGAGSLEAFEQALRDCASSAIARQGADLELGIALAIAVIGAVVAIYLWRWASDRWPLLRSRTQPLAWGVALRPSRWLEIRTTDGEIYSGYNREVADPGETDDLDLYLGSPARIVDGEAVELTGVEGLLIRRDEIKWIRVMAPPVDLEVADAGD